MDLFHDCVKDLGEKIAKMMGINSRIKRMDSLMIEANIRNLSRIELLYSCVARAVKVPPWKPHRYRSVRS